MGSTYKLYMQPAFTGHSLHWYLKIGSAGSYHGTAVLTRATQLGGTHKALTAAKNKRLRGFCAYGTVVIDYLVIMGIEDPLWMQLVETIGFQQHDTF